MLSGIWDAYQMASQVWNLPFITQWSETRKAHLVMFIGFAIFFICVFVLLFSIYNRVKGLEEKQPSVKLYPRPEGQFAYLEVENRGNFPNSFIIQILKFQGIEKSNAVLPYCLRWETNLNNPNAKKFLLIPHERNKLLLIKNDGLTSFPEDAIQYQNVKMRGEYPEYSGQVLLNSKITVSVEVSSDYKMKNETIMDYTLLADKKGEWVLFEEVK